MPDGYLDTVTAQETERAPPHNVEAEQALLGAIFMSSRAYESVAGFLRPEHFANALHGRIYEAAAGLLDSGQPANPVTLAPILRDDADLQDAGGRTYLAQLANAVVTVVNADDYGRQIRDAALRRQAIEEAQRLIEDASAISYDRTARDVLTACAARLDLLIDEDGAGKVETHTIGQAAETMLNAVAAARERGSGVVGMSTTFKGLDHRLGGMERGDYIVLAGRPSQGKTALALNIAVRMAEAYQPPAEPGGYPAAGARVAFASLEMTAEQLALRAACDMASVPIGQARRGQIDNGDWHALVDAQRRLAGLPMTVLDKGVRDLPALRAQLKAIKRSQGLDLVVIDYLQLIAWPKGTRSENEALTMISNALKPLAKDLGVALIVLSQLNRGVEARDDKRPLLSDLRGSGSIEQDADAICMLYREQYYLERAEPARRADESEDKFMERQRIWMERCEKAHNVAEVIVPKVRQNEIGTVHMYFDGQYGRFGDLVPDERYGDGQHTMGDL